jgi:uncharacterized protein
MKKWLWLGALAAFCAPSLLAVDWKALQPRGYVSDFAGVIDAGTKSELETYCGHVEQSTGVRISLLTIASLEGEPLEDVARSIFRGWGESDAPAKDQRVMLILTVADRHDWVETGAGLPATLTSSLATHILRESRVALRKQNYGEALRAAAETIGNASARERHVTLPAPIVRHIRWSLADSIPWAAVVGGVVMLICLIFAGSPKGYGGHGSRGLIPCLVRRNTMQRATWGSRGTGGFGCYDSGDSSGGFGGGCCSDW